jgi:hypothetical protein
MKTWSESLVPSQVHSAKLSVGTMEIEPGIGGLSRLKPSKRWYSFSGGGFVRIIMWSGEGSL